MGNDDGEMLCLWGVRLVVRYPDVKGKKIVGSTNDCYTIGKDRAVRDFHAFMSWTLTK